MYALFLIEYLQPPEQVMPVFLPGGWRPPPALCADGRWNYSKLKSISSSILDVLYSMGGVSYWHQTRYWRYCKPCPVWCVSPSLSYWPSALCTSIAWYNRDKSINYRLMIAFVLLWPSKQRRTEIHCIAFKTVALHAKVSLWPYSAVFYLCEANSIFSMSDFVQAKFCCAWKFWNVFWTFHRNASCNVC